MIGPAMDFASSTAPNDTDWIGTSLSFAHFLSPRTGLPPFFRGA